MRIGTNAEPSAAVPPSPNAALEIINRLKSFADLADFQNFAT